ncbi:glutaredoxin-like protein NrdH [Brachybacterium tyrofermentans]
MHLCSLLYTKPQCVQCDATKRDLNSRKIEHETVDLTQDADALAKVKEMGYQRAPVVVTEEDHWSGYRPDKIKVLDPNAGGRRQSGLASMFHRGCERGRPASLPVFSC